MKDEPAEPTPLDLPAFATRACRERPPLRWNETNAIDWFAAGIGVLPDKTVAEIVGTSADVVATVRYKFRIPAACFRGRGKRAKKDWQSLQPLPNFASRLAAIRSVMGRRPRVEQEDNRGIYDFPVPNGTPVIVDDGFGRVFLALTRDKPCTVPRGINVANVEIAMDRVSVHPLVTLQYPLYRFKGY